MAVKAPKAKGHQITERIFCGLSPFGIRSVAKIRGIKIEEAIVAAARSKGADPFDFAEANFHNEFNITLLSSIVKKYK